MTAKPWLLGDGDNTVETDALRRSYIYDRINEQLQAAHINDAATFADFAAYLGFPGSSDGGRFGLVAFGDTQGQGTVVIPDTVSVGGYDLESDPSLVSLSFPNLTAVDPNSVAAGWGGYFLLIANPNLTFIATPLLQYVNSQLIWKQVPVASIVLPELTVIDGAMEFTGNTLMVTLSLPKFVHGSPTGHLLADGCTALANVDVSSWVPVNGTDIDFSGDALTAASVELILRRLVLAGVTTCTVDLSGGTSAGTGSLSAQGQADVATLGAQLTINP